MSPPKQEACIHSNASVAFYNSADFTRRAEFQIANSRIATNDPTENTERLPLRLTLFHRLTFGVWLVTLLGYGVTYATREQDDRLFSSRKARAAIVAAAQRQTVKHPDLRQNPMRFAHGCSSR